MWILSIWWIYFVTLHDENNFNHMHTKLAQMNPRVPLNLSTKIYCCRIIDLGSNYILKN